MGSAPRYQLDQFLTGTLTDYSLSNDGDSAGEIGLALAKFCPDALWIEVERQIVFANQAAVRLAGARGPAELLGKSSADFFRDRQGAAVQTRMLRVDGTSIEVESETQGFVWKERKALVRTVRERRAARTEESPLSPFAGVRDVADEPAIGLVGLNVDRVISSWNQGAENILGYAASSMVGQSLDKVTVPAFTESISRYFERACAGETVEHFRTILRAGSGQGVFTSMWISPVRDFSGKIAGATAGIVPLIDTKLLEEVTSAAVCFSDASHRVVRLNPRMAQILGVHPGEAVGRKWSDVSPELGVQIGPVLAQVLESGEAAYGLRMEGGGKPWVVSCRAIRGVSGEILGVSTMLQDPTAPGTRERQIEAALEKIDDPVILADNDWLVTFANAAAARAKSWQGLTLWDLLEGCGPELPQSLRAAKAEHRHVQFENQEAGGAWFENVIHPSVEGILLWRRDVSAHKEAEQKKKENEAIYRAIGDSLDYGIWICDAAGYNIYTSDSFQKLTGLSQADCAGYGWTRALRPEHATLAIGAWQDCVRDGYQWDTEYWFWGVDRRWHPVLSRGGPVHDGAGKIMCWAGIFLDIKAFKSAQQQLEDANESLLRTNQELEQFAYIASHDLQEPLRVIRLMTRLLETRYPGTPEDDVAKCLATIEESSARMAGLVRDLLDYARVLHSAPVAGTVSSLDEALEIAIQNCRHLIDETGAVVTSEPLPQVTSDINQMARVFQNLIANAIKYRREEKPRVHVRADLRGSEWRMCVEDNGEGIPPQSHNTVFLPFKRLHGAEKPGSGLGLAVCKKIVEHHGGRIWLESEVGEGSHFYFTLPMD